MATCLGCQAAEIRYIIKGLRIKGNGYLWNLLNLIFIQQTLPEEEVDRSLWGELESESESESEEEEEEEEEEEDEMELDDTDKSGFVTPAEGGLVTPSGISSIPMGMETPDMIELRKRKIESEMEG